jgi:hypothetical protein
MGPIHPDQWTVHEARQRKQHFVWREQYGGYVRECINHLEHARNGLKYIAADTNAILEAIEEAIYGLEEMLED